MEYSESSKAYRIYFPGYKKINISRDVTFDEDIADNKSRKDLLKNLKNPKLPEFMIHELRNSRRRSRI